jgi:hypothetical protein
VFTDLGAHWTAIDAAHFELAEASERLLAQAGEKLAADGYRKLEAQRASQRRSSTRSAHGNSRQARQLGDAADALQRSTERSPACAPSSSRSSAAS